MAAKGLEEKDIQKASKRKTKPRYYENRRSSESTALIRRNSSRRSSSSTIARGPLGPSQRDQGTRAVSERSLMVSRPILTICQH